MHVIISHLKAINTLNQYVRDHDVTMGWDCIGLRWRSSYDDLSRSNHVKFEVIDKQRFTYLLMKYNLEFEMI